MGRGADRRVGRGGGEEDVFGKVEVGAVEPVGVCFHGERGVDDGCVGARVDQVAGFPHVGPEIGARGAHAPVVEVAEGLGETC